MHELNFPAFDGPAEFDALHDQPQRWLPLLTELAHGLDLRGAVQPLGEGTVLVAGVGAQQILKLYPPFLRDHWAFERGLLQRLQGRLSVPTPELQATGEQQGWAWTLMSRLPGQPLSQRWAGLDEARRCALLRQIGALAAQVHALPVGDQPALAPSWADFLARQRTGCMARQRRTGLPEHLLAQVEDFVAGPVPEGPDVLLTGEYTPMNLLVDAEGERLTGMFDFGDGLVGPAAYDWGGPLCFLAAGHAGRVAAFFEGYGQPFDEAARLTQLRLLLLHRYSHLPIQLGSCPGWEQAASLPELARRIWP
ncbi:hygromycin-B 7''-O-kinase [Inhella inkyongensis]|uniref:Hygromycin-B 7''-O-kinase n=1 Tax=Inhella inkyongensis TaxID=392593 RepID=A0A840S5P0_9BURK|nr:aminoglycoside 3'-phosphotransferase/choline kinase family protein [Inhella inkyongensis]MBB5204808.1 hygromycin-B 7''-O-kinase [Inhella inkyongensis]